MDAFLAVADVDPLEHLRRAVASSPDGHLAAALDLGVGRSLAMEIDDVALTLRTTADGVHLEENTTGDVRVAMARDDFSALAAEAWSMPGLLYNGRLQVTEGDWGAALAWDPVLQAVLFGRPVYDETAARAGGRLTARSFDLDTEFDAAREFLATAGFVHLRQVFGSDEIATLGAEIDRLTTAARPDDGRSWWTTDGDGTEQCCRVTYTAQHSEAIAGLEHHPLLRRIATMTGEELWPAPDRMDGFSCVIKRPDARSGLADLPWHRDCGNGGHPVICPGLNVGIQLDPANAANGQLAFLAGSHAHAGPRRPDRPGLPRIDVDTEPGDVTVHYGHCLHIAPPPSAPDAGRRALYCGFYKSELFDVIGPMQSFNDVLFEVGDGGVLTPDEFG